MVPTRSLMGPEPQASLRGGGTSRRGSLKHRHLVEANGTLVMVRQGGLPHTWRSSLEMSGD